MQMLDVNNLFTIELRRNEISEQEFNMLAQLIDDLKGVEMKASINKGLSVITIGAYQSYFLNELIEQFNEERMQKLVRLITKKRNDKISESMLYA